MKKSILLFSLLLSFSQAAFAQVSFRKADSLFTEGLVLEAIEEFKLNYNKDSTDNMNLYQFSCVFAQIRMPDSAFKYLMMATKMNSTELALTDPDLIPLYKDKRWGDFEKNLIALMQKKYDNPIVDVDYAQKLWRMRALDQAHYRDIELAQNKINKNTSLVYALWDIKEQYNTQNQKDLEALIAKKGWPKISQVGSNAASSAFLIIQHADLAKQKKYLPIIKKLCEEREAHWGSYALMYDRVQVTENKPQRYGSQVHRNPKTNIDEPYPLEDESKVDEWRKEMGMQPLADYLMHWNIKWEPKPKQ